MLVLSRSSPFPVFFFVSPLPLVSPWPFMRILVTFSVFHVHSPLQAGPLPACSFILISFLGSSPIGRVSACFWSYPSTRKQSTLHIIEGGMGGKPTGFIFCLLWGFFLQYLITFYLLYVRHSIASGF